MTTDTAEQYVQNFKKYQRLSGHNNITLREMFEKGLIKRIKEHINLMDPIPTRLLVWQDKAIQFD